MVNFEEPAIAARVSYVVARIARVQSSARGARNCVSASTILAMSICVPAFRRVVSVDSPTGWAGFIGTTIPIRCTQFTFSFAVGLDETQPNLHASVVIISDYGE
jgi:hypothetical protein